MTGELSGKYVVLGARGFIGSRLSRHLRENGAHEVITDASGSSPATDDESHVIYCIGVTADFRSRPLEAIKAHVSVLTDLLLGQRFASLTYLSSTRVYEGLRQSLATEESALTAHPQRLDDVYKLSKLTGEAACLCLENPRVRAVRLSNVIGHDPRPTNFVPSLVYDAVTTGVIRLRSAPEAAKDYVALDDVLELIPRVIHQGHHRLYNIASGVKVTNREIVERIAKETGCAIECLPASSALAFPDISITRASKDFGFVPRPILPLVGDMCRPSPHPTYL